MWKRRLFFSLVFVLGTCMAVLGWMQDGAKHRLRYLALAGHAVQVVGIIGSMLTPDRQEHEDGEGTFEHMADTAGGLQEENTEANDHLVSLRE